MTAFTVWKFDSPEGAEHASRLLEDAADDGLVKVLDHAVVSWPAGASHPDTKHSHDEERRGAGWGSTLVATNLTESERRTLLETFGG
jgi:uncharacterized membrane protein